MHLWMSVKCKGDLVTQPQRTLNISSGTCTACSVILSQSKDQERSQGVEPDAVKVASPVLNEGDVGNVPKGNAPSCPYPVSAKSVGCSMRASSTVILS